MASLSLKNIYKRYPNGFEAVKDFNLEVEDNNSSSSLVLLDVVNPQH
jgi:ABC-type sugar transport system ATPase subunit